MWRLENGIVVPVALLLIIFQPARLFGPAGLMGEWRADASPFAYILSAIAAYGGVAAYGRNAGLGRPVLVCGGV